MRMGYNTTRPHRHSWQLRTGIWGYRNWTVEKWKNAFRKYNRFSPLTSLDPQSKLQSASWWPLSNVYPCFFFFFFLTSTFKVTTFHLLAQKIYVPIYHWVHHYCVTELSSLNHVIDTWCAEGTGQQVTLNPKPHFLDNLVSCELSD